MKPTIEIDDDTIPSATPDEMVPVGLDGLLGATEKVLGMNRGLLEQDHRDSITNKRLSTPADLMAERVKLDVGGVLKKMVFGAAKRRSLASFSPGALTPLVESHLIGSPLASALEQINPVDEMNQARRVTLMGPGGIGSSDQVTNSMQAVDVGAFGFMSPVEGPECFSEETEVRTKLGWKFWPKVTMDDELSCQIDGRLEWHKPTRLIRDHYKGDMILGENADIRMCVTPNHRVFYKTESLVIQWSESLAEDVYGTELWIPEEETSDGFSAGQIHIACDEWSRIQHDDLVYCATVPGGMLLVRGKPGTAGFWTGNSENAGIDTRLADKVKIGSNGRLYQLFRNPKTGNLHWLSPEDLVGRTVGLPK